MDPIEAILRVGVFGCFLGHGWIAAWKLEFSGWSTFMAAAGFRTGEAHVLMPLIGWMDILLACVTLVHPTELTTAWMVVSVQGGRGLAASPIPSPSIGWPADHFLPRILYQS